MNKLETVIYNLIVMLYDYGAEYGSEEYSGLDDPKFKSYVCAEAGIEPEMFDKIMGGDE